MSSTTNKFIDHYAVLELLPALDSLQDVESCKLQGEKVERHEVSVRDSTRAYRRLALVYHPDKWAQKLQQSQQVKSDPSASMTKEQVELKFEKIGKAADVLGDELKKQQYDAEYAQRAKSQVSDMSQGWERRQAKLDLERREMEAKTKMYNKNANVDKSSTNDYVSNQVKQQRILELRAKAHREVLDFLEASRAATQAGSTYAVSSSSSTVKSTSTGTSGKNVLLGAAGLNTVTDAELSAYEAATFTRLKVNLN